MMRPLCSRRTLASLSNRAQLTRSYSIILRNSTTKLSTTSSWQPRPRPVDPRLFNISPLQCRRYAETMVKVPEMAESISEGTLKQFSKGVGEYVEQDEEIATIETDKIDVSVNAPAAGTIKEFLVSEEDTVTVGQEIAKLDTEGTPESSSKAGPSKSESQESSSKQESQQSSSQQQQQQQQEKSSQQEQDSRSSQGQQQQQQQQQSQQQQQQSQQQSQQPQQQSQQPQQQSQQPQQQSQQPQQPSGQQQSSAQQTSGAPAGAASRQQQDKGKEAKEGKSESRSSEGTSGSMGNREERRVKMNRMRLRIAERLKQSQNTAASLTTFQKVDMHSLMEFRKQYKDDILKKTGVKLGFMGAFTRASILAMREVPAINASIEGQGGGDTIVYRDYVDVSVAVATEKGLVTPVVRNAETLDMVGIEGAIAELGKKARDNKLTIEDMAGGTYTISNGGVFGSLFGTPIINLPQTAVLGLHAINDEVVVVDGKFEARPIMYLALTYDHRLVDGREAVTFLVKVKQFIEDPRRMLLGGW